MYQTVGQDAIHLVAEALAVPLYRRVITGAAVEQNAEYGGRNAIDAGGVPGDETEDMYDLLTTVKVNFQAPLRFFANLNLDDSLTTQIFNALQWARCSRTIRECGLNMCKSKTFE